MKLETTKRLLKEYLKKDSKSEYGRPVPLADFSDADSEIHNAEFQLKYYKFIIIVLSVLIIIMSIIKLNININ